MPPKKAMKGPAKKEPKDTPMKGGSSSSSSAMKVKKEEPMKKGPKKEKNPVIEKMKACEAMLKSAE